MEQNDFIKGALVGGVLGGVAALLMAPKSGKDLRDDISEGYQMINKRSHDLADGIREQGQCWMDSINGKEESHHPSHFFVGGTIGAVIGAVAALLLAPSSGNKLREHLGDSYEEIRDKAEAVLKGFNNTRHNFEGKIDDWKDTFLTIVDKLSSHKKGDKHNTAIDEIVNWANLGLRLYSQMQKKR